MKCGGSYVTVSRRVRGSGTGYTQVLSTSNAQVTSADRMRLALSANASYSFDDFALLADRGDPIETLVYAHNDANEQTSMTVNGVTTSMSYDAWGRLTGKTRGAHSAEYDWAYGGKLLEAARGFPDEGTVAYEYGGDGKRRAREAGSDFTWYNWAGWQVTTEQDAEGDLARTYVGRTLAHIDGENPATGTAQYYLHDHLGSARQLRAAGGALTAAYDSSPYGEVVGAPHPAHTTRQFTGHDWDPAAGFHFAPFRYYSPGMARWLSRDPLGMVDGPNVYAYVGGGIH